MDFLVSKYSIPNQDILKLSSPMKSFFRLYCVNRKLDFIISKYGDLNLNILNRSRSNEIIFLSRKIGYQ